MGSYALTPISSLLIFSNNNMYLTTHFTLEELCRSSFAIKNNLNNVPSKAVINNLLFTARKMERIRAYLGGFPIIVTSGFRSREVNSGVGGSHVSDHVNGLAVDFIVSSIPCPKTVADIINTSSIKYDQLILYNTFLHIGFGARMRQQFIDKRE